MRTDTLFNHRLADIADLARALVLSAHAFDENITFKKKSLHAFATVLKHWNLSIQVSSLQREIVVDRNIEVLIDIGGSNNL